MSKVFPEATILPSRTLTHDSFTVGLPVALQYIVTFILSCSKTVMFWGTLSNTGETGKIKIARAITG